VTALVHDAARCPGDAAADQQLIDACQHAFRWAACWPTGCPTRSSRQQPPAGAAATLERSAVMVMQTPQMFRDRPLARALDRG
jgi:2-C-methyl-D-erythritol 4-phosphate cytidylyltransferase